MQFQKGNPGRPPGSKNKTYIERVYDSHDSEERAAYVNRYQNDPQNNPEFSPPEPPPPLPKPLANTNEYLASLGDGSKEYLGLKTGFKELDTLTSGLQKFTLFAGAGGTGKSTLAAQLALGVLENEDCPVIYYSLEMHPDDVYTMLTQLVAAKSGWPLTKEQILLHGNDETEPATLATVHKSVDELEQEYGDRLYILTHDDAPDLPAMQQQITAIMASHGAKDALVIIDSVQDIIPDGANRTEQEATTAQKISQMQQATGATILGIAQKSKAGITDGGYASVLGSVSWIHKPTTVVEFIGVKEAVNLIPKKDRLPFQKLSHRDDMPQPVIARVIKGRNTGYGTRALQYHGKHGYFEPGRVPDYETDVSIYDLLGVAKAPSTTGLQS